MLDIKLIRENPDFVSERLRVRGDQDFGISKLTRLDGERREKLQKTEELKRIRNETSRKVGALKKAGENTDTIQAEMKTIGEEMKILDGVIKYLENSIEDILLSIPNLPHESVPKGESEEDNVEVRQHGRLPQFDFTPKPHNEIGEALGILDFKRAAKIASARFVIYRGAGARLERALINFMLDLHTKNHGYTEMAPPLMVNSRAMTGTGQLPKFAEDLFKIEDSDFWLIPTAEVPITNIHSGEILDGADLPLKMVAYTPCFRAEAGSYGRDTTGLIRQHQFNKVELVKIVDPDNSDKELESLTANAEEVLRLLNLPYRVVTLCSGDLGFSAAKTYDIEVWVPSQDKYREISSCTTFTDYQARRMGLRFRVGEKGKVQYAHTINGSALAVGRTVVAILENYQQKDGSVKVPEALQSYMGGLDTIRPE